ncbi:hypothetical protein R80B4_01110 [Fibrobacteres bacterium R8-0-B4]
MATIANGIFEYDEEKDRRNIEERGLSFQLAEFIFADPDMVSETDDKRDYGEPRYLAYGLVDGKRLRLCWTPRGGRIRVISLHKIHRKEWEKHYGKDCRYNV